VDLRNEHAAPPVGASLVTREWLEACDQATLVQVMSELERARITAQVATEESRAATIAAQQDIPGLRSLAEALRVQAVRCGVPGSAELQGQAR